MAKTFHSQAKRIEKLTREEKISLLFDLIHAFGSLRNSMDAALFLQDLLTENEIRDISIRLRIAKLLLSGKTHREVINEVRTSFATVTKINLWLQQGGEGFRRIISKLPKKYEFPRDKLPPGPIEFYLPQILLYLARYGLAKLDEKEVKQFIEKVGEKRILDKNLQEAFDEYHRNKKSKTI